MNANEDRSVLVVGLTGHVFGLSPATGAKLWEHEVSAGRGEVEIIVHAGRVYALGPKLLLCIEYPSGRLIGKIEVPTSYPGRGTMLLEGERLFVATLGELFGLSLNGQVLWKESFKGRGMGSMSLGFPDNVRQADDTGSK